MKNIQDLKPTDAIRVTREEYPQLAKVLDEAGKMWIGNRQKFTAWNPWDDARTTADPIYLFDFTDGITWDHKINLESHTGHLAADFIPKENDQRSVYFSYFDKLPKEYADVCKKMYDEGKFVTPFLIKEVNCVANAVNNLYWGGNPDFEKITQTAHELDASNISDTPVETEEEKLRKIYFEFYDNLSINNERIDQYYIDACKENWDYGFAEGRNTPTTPHEAIMSGFDWSKTNQYLIDNYWWGNLHAATSYQTKSKLPPIPNAEEEQLQENHEILQSMGNVDEQPSAYSINVDEQALEMSHEMKVRYMEIATRIVGFNFHKKDLDLFVSLYELVLEKEGGSDLDSVFKIQQEVEERNQVELK